VCAPPPSVIAVLRFCERVRLKPNTDTMSHEQTTEDAVRQIQDHSFSASPLASTPANPGHHATSPSSPGELSHPPEILVKIIAGLLADRTDAAAILMATAAVIAPTKPPVAHGSTDQPGGQPGITHQLTSPPTVEILRERSRKERDAELRMDAVSVSAASSASAKMSLAPTIASGSPGNMLQPLISADDLPASLLASPGYQIIILVLRARLDETLRDWRTRSFYEEQAVADYRRWARPEGQPHSDAADALAELSDSDVLGVSPGLLSPHPDKAAEAWNQYRRVLIHALHRAFEAGVNWRRALRALSLVYGNVDDGHPRIDQYVTEAMKDRALVQHPLLHADVIIFKLDMSFSDGSKQFSSDSCSADWERASSRRPGEDLVTLATRVVGAYLKKVNDPDITTVTVWDRRHYTFEIKERFMECLGSDEICPDRGHFLVPHFTALWSKAEQLVARREQPRSSLNIAEICYMELCPIESANSGEWCLALHDDDDASTASGQVTPRRAGTTGRAARERRAERRRAFSLNPNKA
jgi:hypothetical protein